MQVYQTRWFVRWASSEGIEAACLCDAVDEVERGLVDALLGAFLIKKRMAAPGRGKSGSYRTILAFRQGDRAIFLYGFAKNQKGNVSVRELATLRRLTSLYMSYDSAAVATAVREGELRMVDCDEQNS